MNKILNCLLLMSVVFLLPLGACDNDDLYNDLPEPIAKFVAQYYPGVSVSDYTHTATTYHVKLQGGPGMTFNDTYDWVSVNGYGEALPQVFLFDNLPPALYEYLQTGSLLDSVMSAERTSRLYTVVLVDTTVYFDVDSGVISQGKLPTGD